MSGLPPVEKADHWNLHDRPKKWKQFLKRLKARAERRLAKKNPECSPGYGKYKGWNS